MDTHIILLIAALIAATVLGSYNRIVGGLAGIIICIGVGVWGVVEMEAGKIIAFFGRPLSRSTFLLLVGGLARINVVQIIRGVSGRKRRAGGE